MSNGLRINWTFLRLESAANLTLMVLITTMMMMFLLRCCFKMRVADIDVDDDDDELRMSLILMSLTTTMMMMMFLWQSRFEVRPIWPILMLRMLTMIFRVIRRD